MTDFESKIVSFIKESQSGKRYLCEFEKVITVSYNKRYEWQIRGSLLAKIEKKGLIVCRHETNAKRKRNRQTIYYYLPKHG